MSTRPYSLNDENPVAKRIRRDQFRRVRQIVTTNSQHPEIAIGLVRDFFGSNSDIGSIRFSDDKREILVTTRTSEGLQTEYRFSLYSHPYMDSPTL